MSTSPRKPTSKPTGDESRPNPSAAYAAQREAKRGQRDGLTPAAELEQVPAELDEPDEVTPANTVLYGICVVCSHTGKLDEGGALLPHPAGGHGTGDHDHDGVCDGAGQAPVQTPSGAVLREPAPA